MGADQRLQQHFLPVGPLRRRRQSEAVGCDGPDRGGHVRRSRQVMAFIEHEQAEAMAPAFDVDVGGIVGRHRDGLNVVITAAQQAHRHVQSQAQLAVPLRHEVDGRRHHQGRPADVVDGENGHEGFARARGKDDDPPAALPPPDLEGLELVRKRIAADAQGPGRQLVGAGFVLVGDLLLAQMFHQRPVRQALGAVDVRARIVFAVGQGGQLLRRAPRDDHGAALERQMNGGVAHAGIIADRVSACHPWSESEAKLHGPWWVDPGGPIRFATAVVRRPRQRPEPSRTCV